MKEKRVRCFFVLLMALVLTHIAGLSAAQEKQAPVEKVAAVNGSVITQGDLDRQLDMVKQRLASEGRPVDETQMKTFEKKVLESLVDHELLLQESRKKGIEVEDSAVNAQLDGIKKSFSSEEEFKNAMLRMNYSKDSLETQIKSDLAIGQFIDTQFSENITISDKETKGYYDSHPNDFKNPAQVKVSHILTSVDSQADEASRTAARKKVEEIQQKLENGEDFASLAKEFSKCPSSNSGGDLGYLERGKTVKPFEDAAFALAPGETSGIVETKFGYHIIRCTDKKSETIIPYEEVKGNLQEYLKQRKVQEQVIAYLEELKKTAKVERFLPEGE